MTILITGAGGFIGGAITSALLDRGERVRLVARSASDRIESFAQRPRVEVVRGDLTDRDVVLRAAEGCRAIMHVAAKAGVWGPYRDYYRSNVIATERILEAARAQGIAKLVYTSTPSVVHAGRDVEGLDERAPYAERFETAYPETKAIAERMVLAANGPVHAPGAPTPGPGLATIALRPHLVWGPGDTNLVPRILDRARSGRLVLVEGGRAIIDATYIDSAVHAHLLALDRVSPAAACAGRAYFIAQGEPMPMAELIEGIVRAARLPYRPRSVSAGFAVAAGAALETAYRALRLPGEPPLTRFVARQLATSHHYDLSAAKRDLGYSAPISTEEGLSRLSRALEASRPSATDR